MTIEQKARAYDESLERAKAIYQGSYKPDMAAIIAETLQNVFPALKESEDEDERIRKELIHTINLAYDCGIAITIGCRDKYLAWLEKQRKKVEPKFKAGDWVVLYPSEIEANRKVVQISMVEICQLNMYWTTEGTWFGDGTDARLWTINDAKDGDVLACNINKAEIGGDIEKLPNITPTICMYQNVVKDKDYIHSYCSLYDGSSLVLQNRMYYNTFVYNIHPATKEQRDTLMKAMKEAGYTFDFEKKQLKKLTE